MSRRRPRSSIASCCSHIYSRTWPQSRRVRSPARLESAFAVLPTTCGAASAAFGTDIYCYLRWSAAATAAAIARRPNPACLIPPTSICASKGVGHQLPTGPQCVCMAWCEGREGTCCWLPTGARALPTCADLAGPSALSGAAGSPTGARWCSASRMCTLAHSAPQPRTSRSQMWQNPTSCSRARKGGARHTCRMSASCVSTATCVRGGGDRGGAM